MTYHKYLHRANNLCNTEAGLNAVYCKCIAIRVELSPNMEVLNLEQEGTLRPQSNGEEKRSRPEESETKTTRAGRP